jgi:orotate phosphoribosyltransferase
MKSELLSLLKQHSYKKGDFTLASGKKSPYFIDCKQTLLLAEGHVLSGRLLLDAILFLVSDAGMKVDAVAGVALGGCSIASAVSVINSIERLHLLDVLYIRKEEKDHGTKKLIEGNVKVGSNIVLLEDTITTGGSSVNALTILKDAGYNPVAVIAVVDRLEGGSATIREKFGIPAISLFTIKDFQ